MSWPGILTSQRKGHTGGPGDNRRSAGFARRVLLPGRMLFPPVAQPAFGWRPHGSASWQGSFLEVWRASWILPPEIDFGHKRSSARVLLLRCGCGHPFWGVPRSSCFSGRSFSRFRTWFFFVEPTGEVGLELARRTFGLVALSSLGTPGIPNGMEAFPDGQGAEPWPGPTRGHG